MHAVTLPKGDNHIRCHASTGAKKLRCRQGVTSLKKVDSSLFCHSVLDTESRKYLKNLDSHFRGNDKDGSFSKLSQRSSAVTADSLGLSYHHPGESLLPRMVFFNLLPVNDPNRITTISRARDLRPDDGYGTTGMFVVTRGAAS
jgi:hypothetical protein